MKNETPKQKLIVVLGPTSSGKSDLAVVLAKKFNGEVISADSRQVYKGMDIGTGKVTKREMVGVPHHLLDVTSPKRKYSVAQFKRGAEKAIRNIAERGKIPILCGGTGFYIQAVIDGLALPKVKPNPTLRKKLDTLSTKELFTRLKKLDPRRAKEIDRHNPRRIIRAIEIATELGRVPLLELGVPKIYDVLQIGIDVPDAALKEKIFGRNKKMFQKGLVAEVVKLHKNGVSWKRMEELGFEYHFVAKYLQRNITKEDALCEMDKATWQYSKRQKTWFKRDKRIKWFCYDETSQIIEETKRFLLTPDRSTCSG